MTAMPAGYRMAPVVVQRSSSSARSRPAPRAAWVRQVFPKVPPPDRYEIEAGKRYRRHVARSLAEGKRAYRPEPQHTRTGIAQDFENEQRQRIERRARDVAIRLGWR